MKYLILAALAFNLFSDKAHSAVSCASLFSPGNAAVEIMLNGKIESEIRAQSGNNEQANLSSFLNQIKQPIISVQLTSGKYMALDYVASLKMEIAQDAKRMLELHEDGYFKTEEASKRLGKKTIELINNAKNKDELTKIFNLLYLDRNNIDPTADVIVPAKFQDIANGIIHVALNKDGTLKSLDLGKLPKGLYILDIGYGPIDRTDDRNLNLVIDIN
jgi:hypothetical protein